MEDLDFDKKDYLSSNKVHIRIQQRNHKKCVLTIQGLDKDLDLKRICRALKMLLKCNGAVLKDEEYGDIVQIQGDHRKDIVNFLETEKICSKDQIIVHGF